MLRMMLYDFRQGDDSKFIALMRDFVETHAGRDVDTADFKRICDKHFQEDMGWFFNQWVYGTAVPKANVQYRLQPSGAEALLVVDIELDRVPPDFRLWMPVVLRAGKGPVSGKLKVTGKQHFEVKLPTMPDAVEFNPLHAMLCDIEVKKL